MNLPDGCQLHFTAENREKTPPVFGNIRGWVFVKTGEIQVVIGKRRNAADSRRKPIYKTRIFQIAAYQHSNAIAFSPKEACFG